MKNFSSLQLSNEKFTKRVIRFEKIFIRHHFRREMARKAYFGSERSMELDNRSRDQLERFIRFAAIITKTTGARRINYTALFCVESSAIGVEGFWRHLVQKLHLTKGQVLLMFLSPIASKNGHSLAGSNHLTYDWCFVIKAFYENPKILLKTSEVRGATCKTTYRRLLLINWLERIWRFRTKYRGSHSTEINLLDFVNECTQIDLGGGKRRTLKCKYRRA